MSAPRRGNGKAKKYYGTIEFLSGQSAAILSLTDQRGEWAGSGRVEGRTRSEIYERAYVLATLNATSKGGRLERFSSVEPEALPMTHTKRSQTCGASVTPAFQHRRANALNIEPIQPLTRCLDKKPDHWHGMSALRWIGSGGDALVFGLCSSNCPREVSRPVRRWSKR